MQKVQSLKDQNPDIKVLLSIGGWNAGNAILNGVAASTKLRANLISSSISSFENYGFDGLDIDWEYPEDSDKSNFVKLLQEMREAFDEGGYLISVTASAAPRTSYDIPAISKYIIIYLYKVKKKNAKFCFRVVDLLNIMTYDFAVPGAITAHNAPLYGADSTNSSVAAWIAGGVDKTKLSISVPFYGHSYALLNEANNKIGAAAKAGIGGPFTKSPGTIGYNEVNSNNIYLI